MDLPFSLAVTDAIAALMAATPPSCGPTVTQACRPSSASRYCVMPGVLEVVLGGRRIGQSVLDRAHYGRKIAESLAGRFTHQSSRV